MTSIRVVQPHNTLVVLICFALVAPTASRTWVDVVDPKDRTILDHSLGFAVVEEDPFLAMETATHPPVHPSPTQSSPSLSPANPPPSQSQKPTGPTSAPTPSPTMAKTPAPTYDPYPPNPMPDFPDPSYYNYDPNLGNPYGPGYPELLRYNETTLSVSYQNNGWALAGMPENFYWAEFDDDIGFGAWKGVLAPRQPERNLCGKIGKQSPIDVVPNGAECLEHHQVRVLEGDFKVGGREVEKQILHNKLRLKYMRRNCSDVLNPACQEPDPPSADFPNEWGGYADLLHVDFKVPSEHMIRGQRFDAEMQVVHLHPSRRRTPTRSVVMQATPTGYNYYIQPALDAFEYVSSVHRAQCAQKRRKERKLVTRLHRILGTNSTGGNHNSQTTDYNTWADYSTDLDDPHFERNRLLQQRSLQFGVWNPHDKNLVPSFYFYGYEGSLTEPPCGEWVTWFVCDTPMIISNKQLEQMKRLLFTHIDGDCNPTSVHYQQSVARPIQDTGGRPVWQCTQSDFLPDDI